MTDTLSPVRFPVECKVRLEFYWQSVALYAVTLIVYVMVKSLWEQTLQQGLVNVVLTDPIVVLLGVFVLIATTALLFDGIAQRSVIVSEDAITFTSRFHERIFELHEIEKITIGKEKRVRARGVLSIVRIQIKNKRRAIRIRPALYENDHNLVAALLLLRRASQQA